MYFVTLMPAASAVAGLSPTARRFRPVRVLLRKRDIRMAKMIARYTMKP